MRGLAQKADPPPQFIGKVARVMPDRGYCFIRGTNGHDYFAHYTEFKGRPFRDIQVGDTLTFKAVETPKGMRAIEIEVVDGDE